MRRARRLGTVFIAQVRSLSRDHAFSRPPDDNSHLQVRHQLPAPNPVQNLVSSEHAHLASDLSPLGRGARLREHTTQENENQEAESLSNENTSASNEAHQRRRDDFYDYEHTRHRAQSPPPLPVNQVQPINQAPLVDQISVANQPQAAPYSNAVGQNTHHVNVPDSYLEVIFSHRNSTRNKPRFPHSKVHHKRNISWTVTDFTHPSFRCTTPRCIYLDHVICISNFLYVVTYTPLAFYLIYVAHDSSRPFLSQSFQHIVTALVSKGAIDSLVYFAGILLQKC